MAMLFGKSYVVIHSSTHISRSTGFDSLFQNCWLLTETEVYNSGLIICMHTCTNVKMWDCVRSCKSKFTLTTIPFGLWRRDIQLYMIIYSFFILPHLSCTNLTDLICGHKCEVTTPVLTRGILEPNFPQPTFGCVSASWRRRFPLAVSTPCWVTKVFGSLLTGRRRMVGWQ